MLCIMIPTRKVVSAIDLAPCEKQDLTLMDIFEWIKENGHEPQGSIYYYYLNDTERAVAEYLTQNVNANQTGRRRIWKLRL